MKGAARRSTPVMSPLAELGAVLSVQAVRIGQRERGNHGCKNSESRLPHSVRSIREESSSATVATNGNHSTTRGIARE